MLIQHTAYARAVDGLIIVSLINESVRKRTIMTERLRVAATSRPLSSYHNRSINKFCEHERERQGLPQSIMTTLIFTSSSLFFRLGVRSAKGDNNRHAHASWPVALDRWAISTMCTKRYSSRRHKVHKLPEPTECGHDKVRHRESIPSLKGYGMHVGGFVLEVQKVVAK